jgi:hypothetical protein
MVAKKIFMIVGHTLSEPAAVGMSVVVRDPVVKSAQEQPGKQEEAKGLPIGDLPQPEDVGH